MPLYAANVYGWLTIIDAKSKREALTQARSRASSASLLRTDVNATCIHRATKDDLDQYRAMGGEGF